MSNQGPQNPIPTTPEEWTNHWIRTTAEVLTARGLDPTDAIKAAHVFYEIYAGAFKILSNPEDYDRIIGGDAELKQRVLTDPVMHALFTVARRFYEEVQRQPSILGFIRPSQRALAGPVPSPQTNQPNAGTSTNQGALDE